MVGMHPAVERAKCQKKGFFVVKIGWRRDEELARVSDALAFGIDA
jgi:hypothetical protein